MTSKNKNITLKTTLTCPSVTQQSKYYGSIKTQSGALSVPKTLGLAPMAIQLDGFSIHRVDRTLDSGKMTGGGVCLFINSKCCPNSSAVEVSTHCSSVLEYLIDKCQTFYPRESFQLLS